MNDLQILDKISQLKTKLADVRLDKNTQSLINTDIRYYENLLNTPEHYRESIAPKADILKLVSQEQEMLTRYEN